MDRLTGKDFEKLIVRVNEFYLDKGIGSFGRYGVQCVNYGNGPVALRSLPDFEGVNAESKQIIFDSKVCSQASFNLTEYRGEPKKGSKYRQLKHMRTRSRFGATCFFLIHWNERQLATKSLEAETFLFPVLDNSFWELFDAAEKKSITRFDCKEFGFAVPWLKLGRARTLRPDWMSAVESFLAGSNQECSSKATGGAGGMDPGKLQGANAFSSARASR